MPLCPEGTTGAPAIRLFNSENGGEFAVFQVGIRKYDSRAENNHRWVNLKVKAFGDLCERIKKMSLKEGSFISLCGDYDEERWTDKDTGEGRSAPVIVLDDIKFSHTGGQKKEQNGNRPGYGRPGPAGATPRRPELPRPHLRLRRSPARPCRHPREMPQNFTGYESFSGDRTPSSRAEELETTMTTGSKRAHMK